jgi:hypothetical protein
MVVEVGKNLDFTGWTCGERGVELPLGGLFLEAGGGPTVHVRASYFGIMTGSTPRIALFSHSHRQAPAFFPISSSRAKLRLRS